MTTMTTPRPPATLRYVDVVPGKNGVPEVVDTGVNRYAPVGVYLAWDEDRRLLPVKIAGLLLIGDRTSVNDRTVALNDVPNWVMEIAASVAPAPER